MDHTSLVNILEDQETTINHKVNALRNCLQVDHVVFQRDRFRGQTQDVPIVYMTYPADWIKTYLLKGYASIDPVVREGFTRNQPFVWDELSGLKEHEIQLFEDAISHGLGLSGASFPVTSDCGSRSLFSVNSSLGHSEWKAFVQENGQYLLYVAKTLHSLVEEEIASDAPTHLSQREREVLYWTAHGHNAAEIAGLTKLSPFTVQTYQKIIRNKLGSKNNAESVYNAKQMGIL